MIYLDESATTKPHPEVINTVIELLQGDYWYNSNSQYEQAVKCRRLIEDARNTIAEKINCLPEEIIFVPSASCANDLAIIGYMNTHDECHNFVTSTLEHASISEIEFSNPRKWVNIVPCDSKGLLYPEQFERYRNCLISVCGACSEIGTVQPIKEIANVAHRGNNVFHSDLVAYWPHMKVDVKALNLDMASLGSHKIGGLKNCGVLYVKKGIKLSPLVFGHNTLFGGTPDIYQICAMAKAAELLNYDNVKEVRMKRDHLLDKLLEIEGVTLNGDREKRTPNNINICVRDILLDNQQLVSVLNLLGNYCISSGSACSSGLKDPSHTLLSLGLTAKEANQSIRITLSEENTYEELDKFYNDFKNVVEQYRA